MLKMNYWSTRWDLDEAQCPCDVHFNEWIARERLTQKTIYHFGTGTHHIVGRTQAENGAGNVVFAITASIEEYEAYVELVTENARLGQSYLAYFGDIYLTNPRLLPEFDVVTLFHLCEFSAPNTASAEYGGLSDAALLTLLGDRLRPGGHALFYKGSFAFDAAERAIVEWEKARRVERMGEFKTLLVYRKM
jgi:SAM-dependent methyltransferase